MKLIKTTSLEFREGKSDKVYEADLCEVGPGRFVVNFRYGRRGTHLREGSKTPVPVSQAKAEEIFNGLVAEKVRGGYRAPGTAPAGAASGAAPAAAVGPGPEAASRRDEAVLARLRGQKFRTDWKLSRVVWRAGELRLRDAEPLLWGFLEKTGPLPKAKTPEPAERPWYLRIFSVFTSPDAGGTESWGAWASWPRWGASADEAKFLAYSAAWALGRCGTAASLPKLGAFIDDPRTWDPARRIALESVRLLLTPEQRAEASRQVLEALPPDLARAVQTGTVEEVLEQLRAAFGDAADRALEAFLDELPRLFDKRYTRQEEVDRYIAKVNGDEALRAKVRERLDHGDTGGPACLNDLYWVDDARPRPALLAFLRSAWLGPNVFRAVRSVYKAAELRDDFEVFGLLTYRFETTRPDPDHWYNFLPPGVPWQAGRKHPMVLASYTGKTRSYLRRRSWRVLNNLGVAGSPDYVRLAEQVLVHYTDEDAGRVITARERKFGWGSTGDAAVDRFGAYYVLNRILYRNSPRYRPTRGGFFVCRDYRPGQPAPPQREEAFPTLWDRAPESLLRLLERSRCGPVHEFAARALRANRAFCQGLGLDVIRRLGASPYEATARLGMELVVERFDPANPDPALVLILADSVLAGARRQAEAWVGAHWGTLRGSAALVVGLIASPRPETRAFARDLMRRPAFPEADAASLVARLVTLLLSLGEDEDARAGDVAETMLLTFRPVLRTIGEPVIRDLLAHPLPAVQVLAGDLVLGHDTFAKRPQADVLRALMSSPHPVVRGVGAKILDQLDDALLKQNVDVLVWLTRHRLVDLRENVRPTVRRLAEGDREFGRLVAERLVAALLVPGAPEGVPSHTARVLRDDLRPFLDDVPADVVLQLLQSRSAPAQEVGGLLLPTNVDTNSLSVEQLVRLAGHDILAVRAAVWHVCGAHPERIATELRTAYRLADVKWEDSRRFAFTLFRDVLGAADWPPEALVGLCDSVRPDVQRFGQEMITRKFRDEDGEFYALHLSEHPDASVQAFAGHFLDRFAANDPAHVRRLQFYCTAVLSRVNRGRVAKEKVFAFLEQAARSGPEAAVVVAEVLARQSATAAVGDRARLVALMTSIHSAYPDVPLPIRVRAPEVRDAV